MTGFELSPLAPILPIVGTVNQANLCQLLLTTLIIRIEIYSRAIESQVVWETISMGIVIFGRMGKRGTLYRVTSSGRPLLSLPNQTTPYFSEENLPIPTVHFYNLRQYALHAYRVYDDEPV
ncbi:hypothetical protein BABINDRAFT_159117 [Babjeviella inositovora NRRL Y-12698]|uniref:Uncharacterized protein n=1 Tax=Babjeviella inositovora NRRL Y-12698 TaxID=984486 RepID=A0A1E3QY26_9ASCO|nr:uncharacterized protein BABINDRAFT_159117 [Babjeviella inositovora NRRL Y-12698]ODQ82553.1 hypothetical protein BABINDRAFT_159117 [Babjeviella inositovora NRRL Y-12698]